MDFLFDTFLFGGKEGYLTLISLIRDPNLDPALLKYQNQNVGGFSDVICNLDHKQKAKYYRFESSPRKMTGNRLYDLDILQTRHGTHFHLLSSKNAKKRKL